MLFAPVGYPESRQRCRLWKPLPRERCPHWIPQPTGCFHPYWKPRTEPNYIRLAMRSAWQRESLPFGNPNVFLCMWRAKLKKSNFRPLPGKQKPADHIFFDVIRWFLCISRLKQLACRRLFVSKAFITVLPRSLSYHRIGSCHRSIQKSEEYRLRGRTCYQ